MRVAYRSIQVILIALLTAVVYNNIYAHVTARSTAKSIPTYSAVYIGPDQEDGLVKEEVRRTYHVAKVQKYDELTKYLENHPETAIIYIHPRKFSELDPLWVRQQYEKGVTVVGINVPIHPLAAMVGEEILPSTVDGKELPVIDLPLRHDAVIVSLLHPVFDETTTDIIGWGWHSDYYRHFDTLPESINALLFGNHKK